MNSPHPIATESSIATSPSDHVTVRNPILRGFNPDPTIVKVGPDFYAATSTFEWYPGVRIHRSRDLAHWSVVGHALDAHNGFDLTGHPDSGGVWAPSLTYADGLFWLAYSVVRTVDGENMDLDNYLVTAHHPAGPWSTPIRLGSRGFDFSFFHDDGRHWIVGVQWDHRPGHPRFAGIVLEEYLPDQERTAGAATLIYQQDSLVEGPNLYRIGDQYHLLLAEGGTGWNHGITSARSDSLFGPYQRDPEPAVLTTRDAPGVRLQKAGHGELVQLEDGSWAMVHLASRPTLHLGERFSTLGRETCVQAVTFDEQGWLRLRDGGYHPYDDVRLAVAPHPLPELPTRDDFDEPILDLKRFSVLRTHPTSEQYDLRSRPGWLRLHGGQSTGSTFTQSMLAQRVSEHLCSARTVTDATPNSVRQSTGLIAWYDRAAWTWLQLAWDETNGRHLRVLGCDGSRTSYESGAVPLSPQGAVNLGLTLDNDQLHAENSLDGESWSVIATGLPAWKLSDDHGDRLRFTGMFMGIRAEDLDGVGWSADFDLFEMSTFARGSSATKPAAEARP